MHQKCLTAEFLYGMWAYYNTVMSLINFIFSMTLHFEECQKVNKSFQSNSIDQLLLNALVVIFSGITTGGSPGDEGEAKEGL